MTDTRRDALSTSGAPAAIGPYSQAIRANGLLFVSGQIPLDPNSGAIVPGGAAEQTHRVLKNLEAILAAAGGTLGDIVKTTVYLVDLSDFQVMNQIYETYFPAPAPARSTIQAARLPRDARIEIDAIAALSPPARA